MTRVREQKPPRGRWFLCPGLAPSQKGAEKHVVRPNPPADQCVQDDRNDSRAGFGVHVRRVLVTHPSLVGLFILVLSLLLFYGRIIEAFPSPWSWGNFAAPLTLQSVVVGWREAFWNPFQYNGLPSVSPVSSALNFAIGNGPIYVISLVVGYPGGIAIFELLSVLLMSTAFFVFTGQIVPGPDNTSRALIRTISVGFLVFNPLMISIQSSGDFIYFIAQSITFTSIIVLFISITSNRFRPLVFVASVALLSLTAAAYQILLLGTLLYLTFLVYRVVTIRPGLGLRYYLKFLSTLGLRFALLFGAFLSPFLLAAYSGPFNTSAQTTQVAPPFANYVSFSSPFLDTLFLHGDFGNLGWRIVQNFVGPWLFLLWTVLLVSSMCVALSFSFIARKFGPIVLATVAIGAALFGAGPRGPIAPLANFLFFHLPGYASLNASYFWEWFVITPLYSVLLLDFLRTLNVKTPELVELTVRSGRLQWIRHRFTGVMRYATAIAPILVVLVLVLPVASQGYYNRPNGIYNGLDGLPASYSQLPGQLENLTTRSGTGAAYFPLDVSLTKTNGTTDIINPLTSYPLERNAYLPFYGTPYTSYSSYFWWLYHTFYDNRTSHLPQLMSIADIKYFVSLYNMNFGSWPGWAYGVNASKLLVQQKDISQILSSRNYGIFSSNLDVAPAYGVHNFTIVDGNYNTLNQMASIGINISQMAVLFQTDLSGSNLSWILSRTSAVVLSSPQSWLDLALSTLGYDCVNPASFVAPINDNQAVSWTSSMLSPYQYPYSYETMDEFAFTSAKAAVSVPIGSRASSNISSTWALVLYSTNHGGVLKVADPNTQATMTIDTRGSYDNLTNSFVWVQLPSNLSLSSELTLESQGGFNAVGPICRIGTTHLQSQIDLIQTSLARRGIPLIFLTNGYKLSLSPSALQSGSKQVQANNYETPGGRSLVLAANSGDEPIASLALPFSGGVLNAQATGTVGGVIQIQTGSATSNISWDSRSNDSIANSWIGSSTPIGGNDSLITLRGVSGETKIGEIVYTNSVTRNTLVSSLATARKGSSIHVRDGDPVDLLGIPGTVFLGPHFSALQQMSPLVGSVTSTESGYTITTSGYNTIFATYSYFPTMIANCGSTHPLYGGLGTLWYTNGVTPSQVTFVSRQYGQTILGLAVTGGGVLGYILFEKTLPYLVGRRRIRRPKRSQNSQIHARVREETSDPRVNASTKSPRGASYNS